MKQVSAFMFALTVANGMASPAANATQTKFVSAASATKAKATSATKAQSITAPIKFSAQVNTHLHDAAAANPLMPIGEGAYQSAEAVAQRTMDKNRDCEQGKWNGCLHNDKADIVDGHSYGHLRGASASAAEAPAPPPAPAVQEVKVLPSPVKSAAEGTIRSLTFAMLAVILSSVV
eukprot:CAMPEP_0172668198 /NCGR_PEP_ID=MMETSP1074-20121228/8912_1 /TAXON_ID=2916 /ORGANISM="Ceratium fusus, Strain PA161109" /LENGTH=175 /DNA_ID=CAMNT_0013484821 /DNA_START=6 /DNA_END=533 /DNA_ORIENTATION=+